MFPFKFIGQTPFIKTTVNQADTTNIPIKIVNNTFTNKFSNQDLVSINVDSNYTRIKNINYSENYLNKDNEFDYYIVKQTQDVITLRESEGQNSKITLDFFSRKDGKLIKSISKTTDVISISSEYLHSTKYGCCAAESYNELSYIWTDETFLKYNTKYYYIEIPNAHINLYLGYLCEARDEKNLVLGELYLAHSLPTLSEGKNIYSSVFKSVNKIIFKAKTKEIFDNIIPFTPAITLVKNTDKDLLIDYPDHQELRLWSFNNVENLQRVDFLGLKIEFEGDSLNPTPIEIPIKNGLLFGDNGSERIVYIDN